MGCTHVPSLAHCRIRISRASSLFSVSSRRAGALQRSWLPCRTGTAWQPHSPRWRKPHSRSTGNCISTGPRGTRYPWTVVETLLLRGDPEYDVGRVLWTRLDELDRDHDVYAEFDAFADAAAVPPDRAPRLGFVRSMSYLLGGCSRALPGTLQSAGGHSIFYQARLL